jgi:triacylglycerol lipase
MQAHTRTDAKPRQLPVLLVHGWNAHGHSLRFLVRHLERHGWPPARIQAVDFENTWASNVAHAREMAAAIDALRDRTGSDRIDIVAHSMGGLATRWLIAHHGYAPFIERVVFIATPHRGTWMSTVAWGDSAKEMRPGSEFLGQLEQHPLPDHIHSYTIRTRLETHVVPASSTRWPGARADHVLNFPPHSFLLRSRAVAEFVRRCLISHDEHGFESSTVARMQAPSATPMV